MCITKSNSQEAKIYFQVDKVKHLFIFSVGGLRLECGIICLPWNWLIWNNWNINLIFLLAGENLDLYVSQCLEMIFTKKISLQKINILGLIANVGIIYGTWIFKLFWIEFQNMCRHDRYLFFQNLNNFYSKLAVCAS